MCSGTLTQIPKKPLRVESLKEYNARVQCMRQAQAANEDQQRRLLLVADHVRPYVLRIRGILAVDPQTTAPMAQAVEFVHRRVGQRGLVFCQSREIAQALTMVFQQAGLSAETGNRAMASFNSGSRPDVLVRATGTATIAYNVRFILHVGLPANLGAYVQDLFSVPANGPTNSCVILWPESQIGPRTNLDRYCGTHVCRYAQIARLYRPSLEEPKPHEFNCRNCDVCITHPRACPDGDDVYRPVVVPFDGNMAGDGTRRDAG